MHPIPISLRIPMTAILGGAVLSGCALEDYTRLYHTEPIAPSLGWDDIESMDYMGPTVVDDGVNFCVYSENAERIELALFDDPESTQPAQQFALEKYGENLWNLYVEGVGYGQHYGYIAWGPNWTYDPEFYPYTTIGFQSDVDLNGNRYNPNKLLTDPYAITYHRRHDWSRGSVASGPSRDESTYAAAAKSVIIDRDTYEWSESEDEWWEARSAGTLEGHDWNELVLYETHVKGFTENTASGVDHPGTYRGFGEKAEYFADLGINAVELLPIHQKEYSLGGYWGYATLNYFAPELGYSDTYQTTGEPYEVLDEFRWMVEQLHEQGIEVIVDVVYNHSGEGGLWENKVCPSGDPEDCYEFTLSEVASIFSMRGLDNAAYYSVSEGGQDFYDSTGIGHDMRANHTPFRKLIMDSLYFYVEELHVDGFRFDLAAVLGEEDQNYSEWNPDDSVLMDIVNDPLFQERNIRIIAEPWSVTMGGVGGEYPAATNHDTYAFAEWNGGFRDYWRYFLNYGDTLDSYQYYESVNFGEAMTGSSTLFGERQPYHSVNYITCHDGYTLYDLFSYDEPRNACGPLNPVCCYDPYSVWCDLQEGHWASGETDWGDEDFKRQHMRNAYAGLLLAHGTPMLYGGDEWLRTQYGNNNAYSEGADNSFNWYRWGEWENTSAHYRHRMHDFVSKLVQYRKDHLYAFSPSEWGTYPEWCGTSCSEEPDWGGTSIMLHYDGGDDPDIVLIVNMADYAQTFYPPSGSWARIMDTQSWYDTPATAADSGGYFDENTDLDPYVSQNITPDSPTTVGSSYTAEAYTIVLLEEQ